MPTYGEALSEARAALRAANIEDAGVDARLLLSAVTGLSAAGLISSDRDALSKLALERFRSHIGRRLAGEPVARILDGVEFWGLHIRLNAATLIPRPDTEILVEAALEEARKSLPADITICDLGTGAGAIAIALLRELPEAHAVATDISAEALAMARENAERLGVLPRLALERSSFADGPKGSFDMVLANPPYIPRDAIEELQREVRDHDPHTALDGGPDGLDAYRAILARAGTLVSRRGFLAFEVGYDQADSVMTLCRQAGLANVTKVRDLVGRWRVVLGRGSGSESAREGSKKALGKVG
jgi:release factor glutamine methyltransferase